jgi:HEAT repeat protein
MAWVELGLAVALMPVLVLIKMRRQRRHQKLQARRQALEEAVSAEDTAAALLHARQWPEEFLELTQEAVVSLRGRAHDQFWRLVTESGAIKILIRDLQGRQSVRTARALNILGCLADGPEWNRYFEASLGDPSAFVRAAARAGLLRLGSPKQGLRLFQGLADAPLWERILFFHHVGENHELTRTFLTASLGGDDVIRLRLALEFVRARGRYLDVEVPLALARHPDLETRIKFFKALPYLRFRGAVGVVLRDGLRDPDWRVRSMAAAAAAQLHETTVTEDLLRLCTVFSHASEAAYAGRALAAFGGASARQIEEILHHASPETRGIAAELIEEQRGRQVTA